MGKQVLNKQCENVILMLAQSSMNAYKKDTYPQSQWVQRSFRGQDVFAGGSLEGQEREKGREKGKVQKLFHQHALTSGGLPGRYGKISLPLKCQAFQSPLKEERDLAQIQKIPTLGEKSKI